MSTLRYKSPLAIHSGTTGHLILFNNITLRQCMANAQRQGWQDANIKHPLDILDVTSIQNRYVQL